MQPFTWQWKAGLTLKMWVTTRVSEQVNYNMVTMRHKWDRKTVAKYAKNQLAAA